MLVAKEGSATAFAKKAGLSPSGFQRYLGGGEPTRPALVAMARAGGVRLEWLATGEPPMQLHDKPNEAGSALPLGVWGDFDLVPLYDVRISAGDGAFVGGETIKGQIAFRKDWLRQEGLQVSQLVAAIAVGDSMEPTIHDGDVLVIDCSKHEPDEGFVYALRINDELRAKRLQRLIDGSVRVSSDNKAYADEVIDSSDLHQLHILGRVVWKGNRI